MRDRRAVVYVAVCDSNLVGAGERETEHCSDRVGRCLETRTTDFDVMSSAQAAFPGNLCAKLGFAASKCERTHTDSVFLCPHRCGSAVPGVR